MRTWQDITTANPAHSDNYAARWRSIAASGRDIYGEARLVDTMVGRSANILDAGCGTGRIGGWLADRGHHVLGTDLDPILIAHAREDYPGVEWLVADLTTDPLPTARFEAVVCAGNVLWFIAPDQRRAVLLNLGQALAPRGRLLIGFGAGRGYKFSDFFDDVAAVGLDREYCFESWDLRPFTAQSHYLVAVLTASSDGEGSPQPGRVSAGDQSPREPTVAGPSLSLSHGLVKKLALMDTGNKESSSGTRPVLRPGSEEGTFHTG